MEGSEQVAWRAAEQCVEITHTECDLSEQTNDIKDDYYGRVRANGPDSHSHWMETESRFKPLSDSEFINRAGWGGGWMDRWMDFCKWWDRLIDVFLNVWVNGWMDGALNGWVDGLMHF